METYHREYSDDMLFRLAQGMELSENDIQRHSLPHPNNKKIHTPNTPKKSWFRYLIDVIGSSTHGNVTENPNQC